MTYFVIDVAKFL